MPIKRSAVVLSGPHGGGGPPFIGSFRSHGGLMVSTLDSGASAWVQALAGGIALCSQARHFTLTVALSTQV